MADSSRGPYVDDNTMLYDILRYIWVNGECVEMDICTAVPGSNRRIIRKLGDLSDKRILNLKERDTGVRAKLYSFSEYGKVFYYLTKAQMDMLRKPTREIEEDAHILIEGLIAFDERLTSEQRSSKYDDRNRSRRIQHCEEMRPRLRGGGRVDCHRHHGDGMHFESAFNRSRSRSGRKTWAESGIRSRISEGDGRATR